MSGARVLIVDDEIAQREMLKYNLQAEGYEVFDAQDGEEALLVVEEQEPDVVILDWMMPNLSGLEVCRQLKSQPKTKNTPVIMLSARSEEPDMVRGLDTGADDYISKPYSVKELLARIRSQLRRIGTQSVGNQLEFQDIRLNTESFRVFRGETELKLGPTEFRLLKTFMEKPDRVFSRDQLLDRVWGRDIYVDTRTVDVHVGRLRKALVGTGYTDPIRTVRGAGYSLNS